MPELSCCRCQGTGAKAQLARVLKKEAGVLWGPGEALESQCRAGASVEGLAYAKCRGGQESFKSCVGSLCV